MKFQPPPRFVLCVAVADTKNITETGLEVVGEAPQARAKVEAIGAKAAENLPGLEVGDVIHVSPEHMNVLRLKPTLLHAVVYDEAVLGWQKAKDIDAPLKPVLSIKPNAVAVAKPPHGIIDGRGMKLNG